MNSSFHDLDHRAMFSTLQISCKRRLESRTSVLWLAILFLGILVATTAQTPIKDGDTGSYLAMSSFRSLGYPVFLKAMSALGLSLSGISWAQSLIYVFSTATLVRVLVLRLGFVAGFGVSIGLLLNPHLARYQYTILSEGLWMSVLLLWVATLVTLFIARTNFFRYALILGALTGLAYAIRPASLAMAPVLLLAPLLMLPKTPFRKALGALMAAITAFVMIAGLERSAHHFVHGEVPQDQFTNLLFARGLMLEDQRTASETVYPKLTQALARDYGPIYGFLRSENDIRVRQFLNVRYEAIAHFGFRPPEFQTVIDETGDSASTVLRRFGEDRILANKGAFLLRGLEHFIGMWTIFRVSTPSGAAALQRFLDKNAPLPHSNLDPALRPKISARPLAVVLQSGLWAAGAFLTLQMIILGGMYLFRRPLSRASLLNLAVILTVQGSYLAIAMLNTSIERFSISYLPLIYVSLMLTAGQFIAFFWNRFSLPGASTKNPSE
jgi:hypothetical protein